MKKAHLIRVSVIAAGLTVFGSVSAFVLLDPPRTWDTAPTYIVDNRGLASITDDDGGVSNTINAITGSQAWNGAGSGTVIGAQAGSVAGWRLGDGIPMLNFDDPEHACNGSCLAATFTGFFENRSDGSARIFDADIVTNDRFAWTSESEPDGCLSEFFIEGVMVHETGHAVGLAHTDVSGATMFPSVSACDNGPASIEQDDIDGLNALFAGGGGDGGGPPACELGQRGDACTSDAECCSGKCKGPAGRSSCR
ncbi:MAG TPA: matrixin family metalloprotease [Woeseiaceae bacterium]|nr:matrixin family metalloprotease [Woeseiaceae bacterium]